eukprot:s1736_g10.t1
MVLGTKFSKAKVKGEDGCERAKDALLSLFQCRGAWYLVLSRDRHILFQPTDAAFAASRVRRDQQSTMSCRMLHGSSTREGCLAQEVLSRRGTNRVQPFLASKTVRSWLCQACVFPQEGGWFRGELLPSLEFILT